MDINLCKAAKMEIELILSQLKDTYEGNPWFGRNAKALLNEVDEQIAFVKFNNQHSILELLWHIITWREFTISRLRPSPQQSIEYFEQKDWQKLDHNDKTLWPKGLKKLYETQKELIYLLQQQDGAILEQPVKDREYNFRKLLYGVIQHDIYHLGQIAYVNKAVRAS